MRVWAILLISLLGSSLALAQTVSTQTRVFGAARSYLGVGVQEIDSDRAKALKLTEPTGVEVTRVEPDSPADKAGVKTGDVILQYHGQRVDGIDQFSRMVRETPPGRDVQLEVFRNGASQTLTAKITSHRDGTFSFSLPSPPAPLPMPDIPRNVLSWRTTVLGIEAESLEGQLAQYFGVTEGVLVRSVTKGSAAEKAGIKAGDVITRVGDSKVSTPADVSSRLRAVRGKPVPVTLMRDRKEVTVNVSLEDRDQAGNPFGIDGGFWRQTQPVTGPGPGPGPGLGPGLGPAPLIHFEPDARFRSGATSGSVQ